ncbi:class I tRNA ligase family protein [Patescibacteria group bacterium]|nr:class I tRNA ligase family protein [Patescibacteria group bacterium]
MEIPFPKLEKKILNYWRENKIFEKSINQRAKARDFIFYEGPPTANGRPGIHHVLARAFKDIIPRYKTMRGFRVLRKAGWDTHGLPVELEVEKKLSLKNKKDIEEYGIGPFNKKCKESIWDYKKEWEELTERIGFWLDLKNPYITYETDYIETLWQILKIFWQKKLLYQDYKVVPYCARCGTALSSHEVAQGYKKVKENSVYVKFPVKNKKNTYFLVWTTTPWTLPGNVAIAANPKFIYAKVKVGKEYLILAKERIKASKIEGEIAEEFKGKDILGLEYEPLYSMPETPYRVVSGDFVSLEEGSGLVHIAPAFGEDDMRVGKENNLPVLMAVDEEGKMKTPDQEWNGMFVKKADPLITEDLKERELLFKEELYEHDYPFCWRCSSPLLYYAKKSWFINMQKVKKDLIKNNQKINWVPAYLKQGRFGQWLKEIKDWALSRERYWGTPLPIWQCKECGQKEVIGGRKDLASRKFSSNSYFILRHGESLRNIKDIVCCWPEKIRCPLTQKGKSQIEKTAKELKNKKIDIIFSSDLLRTKQTAEIVGKELGIKVEYDKSIREIDMGVFNGKPVKEAGEFWSRKGETALEYYFRKFEIKSPEGENYINVKERMYGFLKSIDKKYQGKTILIVGHEAPLTMLEGAVKGFSPEEIIKYREKKKIKTGEYRKIDFKLWPYNKEGKIDFHRPYIDEVKFQCSECSGSMERVLDVIDCWFDSGGMPFAQSHWFPKETGGLKPPKLFPADYISEGIDQTRGWFYTLLAISTLLGLGPSYKNVISLGHVLDEKGEKMSKSKGNAVDPWYVMEKYGADTIRWYFYTVNQPGDAKLFSEKGIDLSLKKFIMTLWNSYLFFGIYRPTNSLQLRAHSSKNILDKWILSKLNKLILDTTNFLDKYDVTGAARLIESFVAEDLSLWYIRRSRRRFQRPETKKELETASQVLGFCLLTLTKLLAPFTPFVAEEIYQKLGDKRSVHLEDWPKANKKLIDEKLDQKMKRVREIVSLALAERAKAKIKVRQSLSELRIKGEDLKKEKELLKLVKQEVNVKEITFGKTLKLNTKITEALKEEGQVREIIRQVQRMRKEVNLKPKDEILIQYLGSSALNEVLVENKNFILKETKAKDFIIKEKPKKSFKIEKEVRIDKEKLWLGIKGI